MEDEEEMSPTGSGIFNSKKMQKIKRQGKPCLNHSYSILFDYP